jgi:predicted O-methyltransferase YrrM
MTTRARGALDALRVRIELRFERLLLPAPSYTAMLWPDALVGLERALGRSLRELLQEPELLRLEATMRAAAKATPSGAPIPRIHNASLTLARTCYLLARAMRPDVVLETGVAFGVTTAFLLKALEQNRRGVLHSIDRPPAGAAADRWVGALVPAELRGHWTLHRGASLRVMPGLLPRIGSLGLFVHDSRHTYRNILGELECVERHLAPGAVVLADDVERNVAFERWTARRNVRFKGVVAESEKQGLLGICVL